MAHIYFNLNKQLQTKNAAGIRKSLLILYPHKQQLNIIYISKKGYLKHKYECRRRF